MSVEYGWGMFFYGVICIGIACIIIYYVLNMNHDE